MHHLNSAFTAEAVVLSKVLQYAPKSGKLLILSDSLSVISAFAGVDQKSPKVILFLHEAIAHTSLHLESTEVIWVPGHNGIQCNELADRHACHLKNPAETNRLISSEDIIVYRRKRFK